MGTVPDGGDNVPVTGDTSSTGSDNTGSSVPPVAAPLAVTLTANGQTSLNLPWTPPVAIGNVNSNYNYTPTSFLETSIDVAWNANNPNAKCTAYSSYAGQAAEQYAPGPVGWGWQVLPGASGTQKANVQGRNASYTLGITCTADGQTAQASVPVTVGLGGGPANSDVHSSGDSLGSGDAHIVNNYHVTLTGNGQSGTITVPSGTDLLLAWSSNYKSSDIRCIATGDWSWKQFNTNGQQFTGPLNSNKVYNISCNDPTSGFLQSQDTLTVYVSDSASSGQTNTQPPCEPRDPSKLQVASKICPTTNTYTPPASVKQIACDQTAQAVVTAAGGCSNISASAYPNVYEIGRAHV
jgi:hypothetical protein